MSLSSEILAIRNERNRLRKEVAELQANCKSYVASIAAHEADEEELRRDHQQYVEWASPQLERLGREMEENAQLREALLSLSVSAQRISEEAAMALTRGDVRQLADPYIPPPGACPAPIEGRTTVEECRAAGQCGCSAQPQSAPHAAAPDSK